MDQAEGQAEARWFTEAELEDVHRQAGEGESEDRGGDCNRRLEHSRVEGTSQEEGRIEGQDQRLNR